MFRLSSLSAPHPLLSQTSCSSPGQCDQPRDQEHEARHQEEARVDFKLLLGRQRQAHTVRHHRGQDGLEAEGEEGVEPEHEAVAVLADVGRNLKAGHGDHHLVEGPEHDVAHVPHHDGVSGGHEVEHHRVKDGDDGQGQLSDDRPVKLKQESW